MNLDELKQIINKSLDDLKTRDYYLMAHDVHEQTISAKLACYIMQNMGDTSWDVDVEYNRNGDVPKSLMSRKGNVKPDIIIHRRGKNNLKRNENNNLLLIELKKNVSTQ